MQLREKICTQGKLQVETALWSRFYSMLLEMISFNQIFCIFSGFSFITLPLPACLKPALYIHIIETLLSRNNLWKERDKYQKAKSFLWEFCCWLENIFFFKEYKLMTLLDYNPANCGILQLVFFHSENLHYNFGFVIFT